MAILVGTAGWAIPRQVADAFPSEGSGLERYAAQFGVTEINSSFHRSHRLETWARWRDSVPDRFRFSVKLPKQITHARKLVDCAGELTAFVEQVAALGDKLAVILVQLPPKLEFDRRIAEEFFERLRCQCQAAVACEPRHVSWFTHEADELLEELGVSRVAADPAICVSAAHPGGWAGLMYWRLHGSPITYRSSYEDRVQSYAAQLKSAAANGDDVWCIFDNTASGAGAADALRMQREIFEGRAEE